MSYKSGKTVTQLSDKESGEIIVKGKSEIDCYKVFGSIVSKDVSHTLSISVKENKLRLICLFETIYFPATSGTRIGTSYISGTASSERSVASMLDGKMKLMKKDRAIFTTGLLNEYSVVCSSLTSHINKYEKGDDW